MLFAFLQSQPATKESKKTVMGTSKTSNNL